MGWFWADSAPAPPRPIAPHPVVAASDISPPPSCPMHRPETAAPVVPAPSELTTPSSCPYPGVDKTPSAPKPESRQSTISKLNPLNWMPANLSNAPAPDQEYRLPMEREPSTIPKGDGSGNWEYPSPQQMYNAMIRKGGGEVPIDAVESMVAVHNFLNEGAWGEILEWERRFNRGLLHGWWASQKGEAGSVFSANHDSLWDDSEIPVPQLVRFMGRPGEMTPKARMLQAAGWALPKQFGQEPPFDRHDWFVRRFGPNGNSKEVRYVIDYYSGPPEDDGSPVFFLDVRPAIDSPVGAAARLVRWGGDIWYRGTGASLRENSNEN